MVGSEFAGHAEIQPVKKLVCNHMPIITCEIQIEGRKWRIYIQRDMEMEKSKYIKELDEPIHSRYCLTIETHFGCDSYTGITNDLVLYTSYYTASQIKALEPKYH